MQGDLVPMRFRNAILALCTVSTLGAAQGTGYGSGSCSVGTGFECSQVYAHERAEREERNWLRAIVLWRTESWISSPAPSREEARARSLRYDELRREAADSGRSLLGTGSTSHNAPVTMTWGFPRRAEDTLFVLGQKFALPNRDSALVVMIEARSHDPARPPRLIGTAWIPADLDPAHWPRHWTSGDTSFTIYPPRDNRILRDALEKVPAVRAFLNPAP
jgi:hypothetical protein